MAENTKMHRYADHFSKMKWLLDKLYYWSARLMPLWWHWQSVYVANACGYFEAEAARRSGEIPDLREHNAFPEVRQ